MHKIHILTEETAKLKKAVGVLQGKIHNESRWEAERYLSDSNLTLKSAEELINDMDASYFTLVLTTLATEGRSATEQKSIASWVTRFGLNADRAEDRKLWEIYCPEDSEYYSGNGVLPWIESHVKTVVAIVIVIVVFVGAWVLTGDVFAAWFLVEILLEILEAF